jgi:uncharacterized damage-inducible protein DinB
LAYLKKEGSPGEPAMSATDLVNAFQQQVGRSLLFMENLDEKIITEERAVGRAQLPSTVIGLLFHAAEHTMRHTGQLLVTVKVLQQKAQPC